MPTLPAPSADVFSETTDTPDGLAAALPPTKASALRDRLFLLVMVAVGGVYAVLILGMLTATAWRFLGEWSQAAKTLASSELWYAACLSVISCTVAACLSVMVAVPIGYIVSRYRFPGQRLVEALFDIPIVLPPLVVGICLLILFSWRIDLQPLGIGYHGRPLEDLWYMVSSFLLSTPLGVVLQWFWEDLLRLPYRPELFTRVTYAVPAVVIGQFTVAAAFAVRTLRVTFDQIDDRPEKVALTLGCGRSQAFWRVCLPQARRGVMAALTLAWARSLGEFGPILVFAGTTRHRTEVLSSSVFLELNVGNLAGAVAVSLLMILVAVVVLVLTGMLGLRRAAL